MIKSRFMYLAAAFVLAIAPMAVNGQGTAFQYDLGGDEGLYCHTADDTSDFSTKFSFIPPSTIAIDFDSTDTLYYIDLSGVEWGTVDPVTAELNSLGSLSGDVPVGAAGMSIDPSTDTMWVTSGTAIWSIDIVTGVATAGPTLTGNGGQLWTLAINSTGDFYGYDIFDDTLYAIDETTGACTAVGTSTQNGVFSNNGMDFDSNDVLYHGLYTGGGTGSYGTWDLNTGVFTTIALHPDFPTLTVGQGCGGGIAIDSLDNTNMWNFWGGTFIIFPKDDPLTPGTFFEVVQGPPPPPPITLPGFLVAMDFVDAAAPTEGGGPILYGIDAGTDPDELGVIDQDTAEWTSLVPITGSIVPGTDFVTDMSYDSSTDTMYVLTSTSTNAGTLHTIDLVTGATTIVAALSNSNPLGGAPDGPEVLAVDSNGNMFVFSAGDDTLWSCDSATGVCTAVGTLTGTTNNGFLQGMDFDPSTDILYHSAIDADAGGIVQPGFYGSWDTGTGTFTAIDSLQNIGGTTPSDLYQFKLAIKEVDPIVDVTPDTLDLITGTEAGGGLAELQASDNMDFRSRRNVAALQSRVVYEIGATSPTETPSALDFTIEESAFARGNVSRTITAFNYTTSSFDTLDTRNASRFGDRTDVISFGGTLSDYVEPGTGRMLIRVRYDGPTMRATFTVNTDHTFWTVTN